MQDISVIPATPDQKPVIANLIQLYLHDMTEFMPFPVEPDGRFAYDFLDRFWRFPYLVMAGNEIAGFALVIDECPLTGRQPCFFMAEFFILKAYRGRGTGRAALATILAHHPGNWHIATPLANTTALAFWQKATAPLNPATSEIQFEGDTWRLSAFTTSTTSATSPRPSGERSARSAG
ncbi:putative acetyltransferase [Devosia sp. LC5]|uniref:GNAT family N-acetyltransferase n=1 Tax=Devosia sp. LC5 TaxID=1502724 RepID=UPI0004E33696|nr:GNAT family N-acetyltransferase [Devosia sp. LC5]KFC71247.1 putative acetyltransferase [Devosia sp. LC5]